MNAKARKALETRTAARDEIAARAEALLESLRAAVDVHKSALDVQRFNEIANLVNDLPDEMKEWNRQDYLGEHGTSAPASDSNEYFFENGLASDRADD